MFYLLLFLLLLLALHHEVYPSASNPIGSDSGGRSMTLSCVNAGETVVTGNGLLVRTVGAILGGYFLACFIPLLIASSALLWVVRRRLASEGSG